MSSFTANELGDPPRPKHEPKNEWSARIISIVIILAIGKLIYNYFVK